MADEDYAIDADPFEDQEVEIEDDDDEDNIDDEELDEFIPQETQVIVTEHINRVADTERTTYNKLTKYEETRLITSRAEQLARGAAPLVDIGDLVDVIEIAKKELKERKIPFTIRRPLHDKLKQFEEWEVKDLIY